MNHLFTLIFLLVLPMIPSAQGIAFDEMPWRDALAKAKQENKLLFIDAYATWCGPCKAMAKYEFTQESLGEFYNENFINLKLDMEKSDGRTFDAQYPVSAYPTMFFLDGEGNVVLRIKGARKASQLIDLGKEAMSKMDFSKDFEEAYLAGNRDFELMYNYIQALNKSNKNGIKIANEYLDSNPEITPKQRLKILTVAVTEADSKLCTELLNRKKEAVEIMGWADFSKMLQNACLNTIDKSIEFQADFLYDEAMDVAKKHLEDDYETFLAHAQVYRATKTKNADLMYDALKYYDKQYKGDASAIKKVLKTTLIEFPSHPKLLKESSRMAEKLYKLEKNIPDLLLYANILNKAGETHEAIKLLEKEQAYWEKKGTKTHQIEMLRHKLGG